MPNNYLLTREGRVVTIGDDELYHWKYIKREKVNGKWRYFYNNEEYQAYKNAVTRADIAKIRVSNASKERKVVEAAIQDAVRRYYEAEAMPGSAIYLKESGPGYTHYGETEKGEKMNKAEEDWYTNAAKKYKARTAELSAQASLSVARNGVIAAKTAYEKTAGAKVADLLNKSSDAINNAKSWVSGLFSKKKK